MKSRMNMGKFNNLVRKAVSSPHVTRVRIVNGSITAGATTNFPLLNCDDDPDYDLATDGTNVAEVQPFSRIEKINLRGVIIPAGAGISNRCEWILYKDPDLALLGQTVVPSDLFTADVSVKTALLRKYTLKHDFAIATSGSDTPRMGVFVKRAALARAGLMHDGDRLNLAITNSHGSVAGSLTIWGTITTRGR